MKKTKILPLSKDMGRRLRVVRNRIRESDVGYIGTEEVRMILGGIDWTIGVMGVYLNREGVRYSSAGRCWYLMRHRGRERMIEGMERLHGMVING